MKFLISTIIIASFHAVFDEYNKDEFMEQIFFKKNNWQDTAD